MSQSRKVGNLGNPKIKNPMYKVVGNLLGRPYLLGGDGKKIGKPFDCLGMFVEFYRWRFSKYPYDEETKKKYDIDNYVKIYQQDKELAAVKFKALLGECLIKLDSNRPLAGDCVLMESDGVTSFGIYCGNGKVLVTSEATGCCMMNKHYYDIKESYRCPQQYL
jgi:cell wall-associated NlpC family hydrolase